MKNTKPLVVVFIMMLSFFELSAQEVQEFYTMDSLKYGPGKVYWKTDRVAEFPGGYERMNEFFSTNFDAYVESNGGMEGTKEGTVEALFIVEKNGKVKYVEITKPLTNAFDEQMETTLLRMPKWKPAYVNGEPVRSFSRYKYTLKFYMR